MWRKNKLKRLVWNLVGTGVKFKEEKEKRKKKEKEEKNSCWYQIKCVFGAHTTPSCKKHQYLRNIILEGSVWWPNNLACVA
jgi:hypothetical protein